MTDIELLRAELDRLRTELAETREALHREDDARHIAEQQARRLAAQVVRLTDRRHPAEATRDAAIRADLAAALGQTSTYRLIIDPATDADEYALAPCSHAFPVRDQHRGPGDEARCVGCGITWAEYLTTQERKTPR